MPRFNGLALVVAVEPGRQVRGDSSVAEVKQHAIPTGLAGVKAFHSQIDRVRTALQALPGPGHHVGVGAHPRPRSGVIHLFEQAVPNLMVMGPGVDFAAHFDQQGDVGTGPETSI
jgi:hypothetical protein